MEGPDECRECDSGKEYAYRDVEPGKQLLFPFVKKLSWASFMGEGNLA